MYIKESGVACKIEKSDKDYSCKKKSRTITNKNANPGLKKTISYDTKTKKAEDKRTEGKINKNLRPIWKSVDQKDSDSLKADTFVKKSDKERTMPISAERIACLFGNTDEKKLVSNGTSWRSKDVPTSVGSEKKDSFGRYTRREKETMLKFSIGL